MLGLQARSPDTTHGGYSAGLAGIKAGEVKEKFGAVCLDLPIANEASSLKFVQPWQN